MDRRLNTYNGKPIYELGEKVWVVDAKDADTFLRNTPKKLIHAAVIRNILIKTGHGVLFDVEFVFPEGGICSVTVPGDYVFENERLATQFCIARCIEHVDMHLEKLEGDIKYAQSQVRVYTEKRKKLYKQLKEACDD